MKLKKLHIFIFLLSATLFSCTNNEPAKPEGKDDKDEEFIFPEFFKYAEVLGKLYGINPEETQTNSPITPLTGLPLDSSSPDTYTIGVDSFEEACNWALAHCIPEEEKENFIIEPEKEKRIDFGESGYLIWKPENSPSCLAQVEVIFPEFKIAHSFDILPKSMLPENDNSLFYRGNIVQDTTDRQYYIVVRACEGDYGIMLSFAGKWNDNKYKYKEYNDWWKDDFELPIGPSEAAWKAYAQMYWDNRENFVALMNDIKKNVSGIEFFGAPAVYTLMGDSNNSYRYAVGEPWGGRHLWWARKVWKLTQRYVYIGRNEISQPNYWTLPSFRTQDYHDVDHDYWSHPSFYGGVHEERFINSKYYMERFVLVYENSI
ncbi:MAG: hypothetical protein K2J82_08060 [Muribaculaceae bacterium]|nr:hypothetical protein [Muribaculaceae bacterium]MDE6754550.1 hypothetical protein [Muribaculaceae bacterium]